MRALATLVTLLAVGELALVGRDAFFWRAATPVASAALVGMVAAVLGLVTGLRLWRQVLSAPWWLGAWGLASVAFVLLMPVLTLRHPAPEDQFGRSVLVAALVAAAVAVAVWRVHHRLRQTHSATTG